MNMKNLWQDKRWMKTPEFAALASGVIYGMLVHSFAMNNVLHNHDNIASQPGGFGTSVPLGRWFLEYLGQFLDKAGLNYNLPFVNGLVYILLLSAAAAVLVSTLKLRSRGSAILVGALFVAFPTVTATMIYRFTVIFYGISALLAVLAVWVLGRFRWSGIVSVVCIALSMGIYQAYVPLTIALMVLQLILMGLREEADGKQLVIQGLKACLILAAGLVLYMIGMKATVAIFQIELSEYQGVSTMGGISISQLPRLVVKALQAVCCLPLQDYCGVANRALMRLAYLALGIVSAGMLLWIFLKKLRKPGTCVIITLLCVAFLLAVGFVEVMVPDGWIYTLMVYSFVLLACAPLAMEECLSGGDGTSCNVLCRKIVALLVMFYGYYANVNYMTAYFAGEQIENYLSGVVIRATMTEGYTTDKQWAMVGDIADPLLGSPWETEISYSGLGYTQYLMNQYSRTHWIENYVGYRLPWADQQTLDALAASEEVQAMPCYPNAGSIRVMGDTVVVKFQDTAK